MKVLRKRIGEPWKLIEIENTHEAIVTELEDQPRVRKVLTDAALVDGKDSMTEKKYNSEWCGIPLFGTVLIVGMDERGQFCDVRASEFLVKGAKV